MESRVVNAPNAWNITKGDSNVVIGIVDDGAFYNHEDLQAKIVEGDFDVGEHGTWVAGVAAAKSDNGKGVASLGWNISLTTWGSGDWNISALANKIANAAELSDVINMSWGTLRSATIYDIMEAHPNCPRPDKWVGSWIPETFPSIQQAVANAISMGVVCVASAGNGSKNNGYGPNPELCDPMTLPFASWPAQYSGVIAVSGTRLVYDDEEFRDGWNYGNLVDMAAPGQNIWTTDDGGGYYDPSGTSFSAPLVSGLAALILSINQNYTINDVISFMTSTADKIDSDRFQYDGNGWNNHLGYGRINAYKALAAANGAPAIPSNLAITNTTNTPIHLSWDANEEPDVTSYEVWRNEVTSQSGWQLIGLPTSNSFTDNDYIWASIYGNETLQYKVRAKDVVENLSAFSNVVQTTGEPSFQIVGEGPEKVALPSEYTLHQNYPNPFNPDTEILFGLPEPSNVKITILDMLGREIVTLLNQDYSAGYQKAIWRGADASGSRVGSGVYFCRIEALGQSGKGFARVIKMTLTK